MNDLESEATYVWEDGSTHSYRNWATGEPNQALASEDCVSYIEGGEWNDAVCDRLANYACKYASASAATYGASLTEYDFAMVFFSFHTVTPLGYSDAAADCVTRGGNLASVEDSLED